MTEFTLIIPTHNRHAYLRRALQYYLSFISFPIIIIDSTSIAFEFDKYPDNIIYLHEPTLSLPLKIAKALKLVQTEYVVMQADDDFVIPAAVEICVQFLKKNPLYSSAQGNALVYNKQSHYKNIEYKPLYKSCKHFIEDKNWKQRLSKLFFPYRSYLWAVHRTAIFKKTYAENNPVKNLFLSEYLSAIIPLAIGYFKELNILYQVRENAAISDDKTTPIINTVMMNANFKKELKAYIEYISSNLATMLPAKKKLVAEHALKALLNYSNQLSIPDNHSLSLVKRIGILIVKIPIIGKSFINFSRKINGTRQLKQVVKNETEKIELQKISSFIMKFDVD